MVATKCRHSGRVQMAQAFPFLEPRAPLGEVSRSCFEIRLLGVPEGCKVGRDKR